MARSKPSLFRLLEISTENVQAFFEEEVKEPFWVKYEKLYATNAYLETAK